MCAIQDLPWRNICLADNPVVVLNEHLFLLVMVKVSMARCLPVENLLPENVGSIINYLQ